MKEFKEKVCLNLIEDCKSRFQDNVIKNEEKLRDLTIKGIKQVIKKAKDFQKIKEDYKIAVFQFEFLRVDVLNENYKICIHGYDRMWYLDENSIVEYLDLKFLYEPFIELKEKLIKEKKIYIGKVNNYDVQEIIMNLAYQCYENLKENIRNIFWDCDEEEYMKSDSIEDFYTIRWSDYHGKSEIVFAMDNKEKTKVDILKLKKEDKEKLPFVYTVWKNSLIEDSNLANENLLFINFKGSTLKRIDFSKSEIVRSQFKDSKINNCEFKEANLVGTSFKNSDIEYTNFNKSNCIATDFQNTNLKDVDFENADLKGSKFINAKFHNVDFKDANLEDAIFNEKDIPFIHLTSEQLQAIYICGGDEI